MSEEAPNSHEVFEVMHIKHCITVSWLARCFDNTNGTFTYYIPTVRLHNTNGKFT